MINISINLNIIEAPSTTSLLRRKVLSAQVLLRNETDQNVSPRTIKKPTILNRASSKYCGGIQIPNIPLQPWAKREMRFSSIFIGDRSDIDKPTWIESFAERHKAS